MSGINICATLGGNTGKPLCDVRMGRIKHLLPTQSKEFTESDLADSASFRAALQNAMLLSSTSPNKIYAFPEAKDVTDNTGDPNTGTLADGYEEVLNEALPKYLLRSVTGVCVQQAMAAFNGWPGRLYVVDENNVLWFIIKSGGGSQAFSCGYLYTNPPKFKGSADVQTANTRVTFGTIDEFKSNVGALKLDFAISSLLNLQSVELVDLEDENDSAIAANNVFIIGGKMKCEGTDIYTAYKTALANGARWRSYKSDNTPIPVTSVTANDSAQGWNVTLDSGTFSGLTPGDVFYIDLKTPDELHGAGVDGVEGIKIRFIAP